MYASVHWSREIVKNRLKKKKQKKGKREKDTSAWLLFYVLEIYACIVVSFYKVIL